MGFIHHWETRLLRSQVKFDHRRTAGEVRRCKKAAAAAGAEDGRGAIAIAMAIL